MKIIRFDNPPTTNDSAFIINEVKNNSTTLSITDSSVFSVNDFVLIERVGNEKAEIVKILSINGNELTTTPIILPHLANTLITRLEFDSYRIKRSTDNITYTLINEDVLDYTNPTNSIEYIDNSINASDSLYYKVFYYNSHTDTEVLQNTLHKEENYGYMTVEQFRQETSFSSTQVTDSEVERAIFNALLWIRDKAYVYHEFDGPRDSIYHINSFLEFADWNGDNVIDKYDLVVYEYDATNMLRTYITKDIVKVSSDNKTIFFNDEVPFDVNNHLVIQIPMTSRPFKNIEFVLKQITRLIASNFILNNVIISKIKNGITSWNAGGTSVNRDLSTVRATIDDNLKEANKLILQVIKTYMRATKLRTSASSLNYRNRYNNRWYNVSPAFDDRRIRRW